MFKKGELTINIIVVAVIALIVLVVLLAIFSGKLGIFNDSTSQVTNAQCNTVVSINDNCPEGTHAVLGKKYTNVDIGYKCCEQDVVANP